MSFSPVRLTLASLDDTIGLTAAGRGSLLLRGASLWGALAPGTIGLPLLSGGAGADLAYGQLGIGGGGTGAGTAGTARTALGLAIGTDVMAYSAALTALPGRLISTTAPLTGGGDLSADRTLAWNFGAANTWTGIQTFTVPPSSPGSGALSERFGAGSSASGYGTLAIGNGAIANGAFSLAIGQGANTGTGTITLIIGNFVNSNNYDDSIVIGINAVATDSAATAIGKGSSAGASSLSFGANTTASGIYSTAIGGGSRASHTGAVSFGRGILSSADFDFSIGHGSVDEAGPGIQLRLVSSTTGGSAVSSREQSRWESAWTTSTEASQSARIIACITGNAVKREYMRAESDGTYALTSIGGGAVLASTTLTVYTQQASNKGLVLKAAAAQTAPFLELQDNSGTALTVFNAAGRLGIGRPTPSNLLAICGTKYVDNDSLLLYTSDGSGFGSGTGSMRIHPADSVGYGSIVSLNEK